jgi:hypothetical protein
MALDLLQITGFVSRLHYFAGLDAENVAYVAGCLVEQRLPAETLVYEQGEESPRMYFIYQGRVQMTRYPRGSTEEQMLGFLDEGDAIGLEVLEEKELRQATIQTTTDVTLLILDAKRLIEVSERIPELIPRFGMAIQSFNLVLRTHLSWVNPEEYVHYITRKHPLFLWANLAVLLLFLIVAAGALIGLYSAMPLAIVLIILGLVTLGSLGAGVWLYIDWSNDYYVVTSQRVVYQERVVLLYDSRQESPMEQVQSTETDRSYLGQLVGYGDVRIRTYTGIILFKAVRLPKEIESIIQEQVKRTQSSLRQAELRAIEEIIARRIGMLPARQQPVQSAAAVLTGPTPMQRFLADLFHLRYEYGDTIQYRTHWWVLVSHIWAISLLLLVTIIGTIMMIFQTALGRVGESFPVVGGFVALCMLGLVFFLWWLYIYLDWHNDIYLITSDQVVDISRKPLGKEEKRAAPIRNILSVEYKRIGIIGLVLNFGTVFIRIGDAQFTFDNVFNPSEVQRELFHRIAMRSLSERQQQAENERQRMAEWIAAYHRLTND